MSLAISYKCEYCNYTTSVKGNYKSHLNSQRHYINKNSFLTKIPLVEKYQHTCKYCSKGFKTNSGRLKHQNRCSNNSIQEPIKFSESSTETLEPTNGITNEIVMKVLDQNQELIKFISENKPGNTTINNTTTHNNTMNATTNFNLNMFLNEDCKDAMNIMDFVASLKYQLEDLERIGRSGYVEGISKMMIDGLNSMEITQRPIHCTDAKRESVYVKDNNEWQKETNNKDKIRRAIKHVAHNNLKNIPEWQKENPEHKRVSTGKHRDYMKMVGEIAGGANDEEEDKNVKKIIKRVAAETTIDKSDLNI
jgi:hypothetical protein